LTWDKETIIEIDLTLLEVSNLIRRRGLNWRFTNEMESSFIEIRSHISEIVDCIENQRANGKEYQKNCISLTFRLYDLIDLIGKNMGVVLLIGSYYSIAN
jgi:hypothetical protein